MRDAIRFTRNGQVREIRGAHPRTTLLDWLRLSERRTGTKEGCAEGDCGACTVALGRLVDGRVVYEPVNACILLIGQCDGADVVAVEDIAADGALHPVQEAMVAHHGSQCGFCTPGIVMSLFTLYEEGARPVAREAVNDALAGNLCRCTGYRPIVDAALDACAAPKDRRFETHREAAARALAELEREKADLFVGDEGRFFAAPASEESLAALLARHPDATILAGATDVGLWITKALMEIEKIVWLGRVESLREVRATPETLTLGAMVSHADANEALAAIDPDLGELMRRFGSVQVRASGTVGGNIANGSPIGDLPPALIALGATLHLAGAGRARTLPLEDFFLAYRKQDREPGEYVRAVEIDKLRKHDLFRCYKVTKRFDEDISAVMGAFRFRLDGRRIAAARIAFGGMAGTPARAPLTETALVGLDLDDELAWAPALDALARDYRPMSDHRASAEYRALVARNLLFKALAEAAGEGDTRVAPRVGLAAAE
ncbi:xanthine dehydrogenase small subunit [Salinarimonas sp.]|uniref:xanthine dehydrogenase small subunit n=1 Tax=Salinarimonas sp. TaxID=2766526 RepID=UPI0032D914BD